MVYTVVIPIFGQALEVVFGSKEEAKARVTELGISEEDAEAFFPSFHCNGLFKHHSTKDIYLLWMPSAPRSIRDYGTLIHEIQHFVYTMLSNLGITHSNDSDEVFSYMMAFVFEDIDMFINENRENDV